MVSLPSTATQAAENDKRRKTQHEKAKANHLTRQLQMRLQYARLKVEHGWQKQNLNEVENLYFHNSHLRGGAKPASSTSTIPIMTLQPQLASSSSLLPTPIQHLPRIGPIQNTPLHNIPASATVNDPENPSQDTVQALVARAASSAPTPDPSINAAYSTDDSTHVDNSATTITPSLLPEVLPSLPAVVVDPTPTTPTILPPINTGTLPLPSPQSPTSSTRPPSSSSTNHYPPLKLPRIRNNRQPAGPKGAHQNLTAKEMLDFASTSTSALTYDSFWSSHSASTPTSRSPRPAISPGANPPAPAPASQNSGLLTNFFAGIDLNQFVNVYFSPSSTAVTGGIEHSQGGP